MRFIGRNLELSQFAELEKAGEAALIVVYGRRRVGKTTRVEKAFASRHLVKFEGIEGKSDAFQIAHFAATLRRYFKHPKIDSAIPTTWTEAFGVLADCVSAAIALIVASLRFWVNTVNVHAIRSQRRSVSNRAGRLPVCSSTWRSVAHSSRRTSGQI
ncbi:MAG: hypothetical protein ABL921_08390 [Pirellula sp.]